MNKVVVFVLLCGLFCDSIAVNAVESELYYLSKNEIKDTKPTLRGEKFSSGLNYKNPNNLFQNIAASFTFSGNGQCSNLPIKFKNTSSGSIVSYAWDFADPNSGSANTSTLENPEHTFVGTTGNGMQSFNVRLTVKNSDGNESTTTLTVNTRQLPDATLGGSGATMSNGMPYFVQSASSPFLFTFVNNSSTKNTNTSYTINWGDNTPDFNQNAFETTTHTYAVGPHVLTYTVVDANGCKNVKTYNVYVGSNPSVGLGSPGNTIICTGNSLTFPITGTESNPPGTIYTVTFNDETPPIVLNHPLTNNLISHTFLKGSCGTTSFNNSIAIPNSFAASVVASNPSGSTPATVYGIYVSEKPEASFTVSPSKTTCINKEVTLTNVSKGNAITPQGCRPGKFVWKIEALTGTPDSWTVDGDIGNTLGLDDSNLWESGSQVLKVNFSATGTYKVSITTGNSNSLNTECGQSTTEEIICVNALPIAKFEIDQNTGCSPLTVKATNQSNTPDCGTNTYKWDITYENTDNCIPSSSNYSYLNNTDANSENPEFNFINAGIYTIKLITSNSEGNCESEEYTQQVTVKSKPTVTIATPTSIVCINEGFSASATTSNCYSSIPETYLWSFPDANITSSTDANPTGIIYSTSGLKTITLTVTNECGTTTETKSIVVNSVPPVKPIVNITYCNGQESPIIVFENTASIGGVTYKWTNSNSDIGLIANGTGNLPAFTATNNTLATISATITVTPLLNDCEGTPYSFEISVSPSAPIANAGPNQTLCNKSSTTLSANNPAPSTGKWTLISGPSDAIISNENNPNTSVSNLQLDQTYKFRWTINGFTSCPSTESVVTIHNRPETTIANAGNDQVICDNTSTNNSYTLQGNADASRPYETGLWTIISEPTGSAASFTDNTLATTSITNLIPGDYALKWTINNDASCLPTEDIVNLKIYGAPEVGNVTSPDNLVCTDINSGTLTLDSYSGSIVSWERSGTENGVYTEITGANQTTYTFTNLTSDTWFRIKITNPVQDGNCPVLSVYSQPFKITVYPQITNSISEPGTYCFGQPVAITGSTVSGGNGSYIYSWETSNNETDWTLITGETTENLNFTANETTYIRRIVESGPCKIESNSILITVIPPLANNIISSDQDICLNNPIDLITGMEPTGGDGNYTYSWQSSTDQNTWVNIIGANQKDYQPLSLTQTTYFRRLVSTTLCISSQPSNIVKITINPHAKAEFTASNTIACAPFDLGSVINVTTHLDKNSNFEWFANNVSIGTGASFPGYTINNDGENIIIKLVTTSLFGCNSDSTEITFNTFKNSVASFSKDQAKGCGPLTVNFNNQSSSLNETTFFWNFGNGETSTATQPDPVIFQAHPLNRDTTYYITLSATTNCATTIYKDSVLVRPKPKAIFSPDKTVGCTPLTVNFTNHSLGAPNTYTIDFGNGERRTLTDNSDFSYTFTTIDADTLTVKLYAENECGIDSTFYDIVINPIKITPELVINGSNSYGCAPLTVEFFNNTKGANNFIWDFNDGSTATSNIAPGTMLHTFSQPGTYTVKLTASNACTTAETTETVVVLAKPNPNFTFNKSQYCVNEKIVFNNTSPSNYTFLWDFGNGVTSNAVNPEYAFTTPGTHTVTLTATHTFPNGTSCSGSITKQLEVLVPPTSTFTTNAGTVNCVPFTLTVNASTNNSAVEWNFGDPNNPNHRAQGRTSQYTFTEPGLYTVKAYAYNLSGCIDSTSQIIQITASPKAEFSPADTIICDASKTITFTNRTTYTGVGNVGYRWFVNNTLVSTVTNLTHQFTPPAGVTLPYTFEVKLVALSSIGCSDTVIHKVQFTPLPKANFDIQKTIDCAPFRIVVNNNSINSDIYSWYLDNTLVSNERIPNNIIVTIPNKTYTLKLVTGNLYGCKLDSIEKTVSTHPRPIASFTVVDSIGCNGKLDLITTNTSIGATSYRWNFGDASPESTSVNPTHTYNLPGTYILRLITSNGLCQDTVTKELKVAPTPRAAFVANKVKGCTGEEITFRNFSENSTSYLWDFGDGTFSGNANPSHKYSHQNSPYSVKLIAYGANGCNDTTVMVNYIEISRPPITQFDIEPSDEIDIPNYTFSFKNRSTTDATRFLWNFGNGKTSTEENPSHAYESIGTYNVRLITYNAEGCADTLTKSVKINNVPGYLYIPNAFEPNNASKDLQTFKLRGAGIAEFSIKIFNTWGQLLWESNLLDDKGAPAESWDGTFNGAPVQQGVYIWQATAKFLDGTEWTGMKYEVGTRKKTGPVHLIR